MSSFKFKLVAYFVLLTLLPVAAAFWGFSTLARQDATGRLDTTIDAELRAVLAIDRHELAATEATAVALARRPELQRLLERKDRSGLTRFLAPYPYVAVLVPGLGRLGAAAPALAEERVARIASRRGPVGTVIVYRPLDARLAARLRAGAGLASGDAVAIVVGGRIVAASPPRTGTLRLTAGSPVSATLDGVGYRAIGSPPLSPTANAHILAVLSPLSLVASTNGSTRERLLIFLLSMLAVVAAAAYVEGRSIVRTLRELVDGVNAVAAGRLTERVPEKGRDEFAQLARAFNAMAAQLESRRDELRTERSRFASAVERIGATLSATHDPDQLVNVLLETTLEATGARSASLVGDHGEQQRLGEAHPGDQRLEFRLVTGQARFGTLILEGPGFTDEQRDTAYSLAAQATVALENARLHSVVEQQALIDELTGLANRRRCEEVLAVELARARRFRTPLSLVLADLDDFKQINDQYGHGVGDAVLCAFAADARQTIRETDLAGRWGGEEFLLILRDTDSSGAMNLAERLRRRFQGHPHLVGSTTFTSTASFGIADYPGQPSAEQLFEAADEALYRAKQDGKNRVER
jgi:diguanylate cyclase (GGDEF)-like protein